MYNLILKNNLFYQGVTFGAFYLVAFLAVLSISVGPNAVFSQVEEWIGYIIPPAFQTSKFVAGYMTALIFCLLRQLVY